MKKFLPLSVVLTSVILLSANIYSQPAPKRSIQLNETQITENLLVGMQSDNKGLIASCTYLIGELSYKKGVIPLLSLLHNAESEEIRILAALSLCKIGDARGVYAVKRAGIFDENERVKRLCNLFYKATITGKIFNTPVSEKRMIIADN
jgi:hypothetical protein